MREINVTREREMKEMSKRSKEMENSRKRERKYARKVIKEDI